MSEELSAREAWLKHRLTGIGSSDAAAVAGVSHRRTPVDVWLEKTERLAPRDDDDELGPMYWGRKLEQLVIDEYAHRKGAAIGHRNELLRSEEHPFMLATVDAIAIFPTGGARPVEAKTTRWASEWGDPESDEVPVMHVFQVQHQLAVTGFAAADIPVLIGGNDFRIYTVERDEEIIKKLIEVEREFWQCVIERVPPPIRTVGDAIALYPKHAAGVSIEADEETYALWDEMSRVRATKKSAEEREEYLKAALMSYMKDAEMLTLQGDVLATWRKTAPVRRVDTKKLEQQHPMIYASCLKEGKADRRFLFKGQGNDN